MFEKMIHDDPEMGAQDDFGGPGIFVSLAFVTGLTVFVFWACLFVFEAML